MFFFLFPRVDYFNAVLAGTTDDNFQKTSERFCVKLFHVTLVFFIHHVIVAFRNDLMMLRARVVDVRAKPTHNIFRQHKKTITHSNVSSKIKRASKVQRSSYEWFCCRFIDTHWLRHFLDEDLQRRSFFLAGGAWRNVASSMWSVGTGYTKKYYQNTNSK